MPKRKPPPEKRTWSRIVNGEWRVYLVSGEVLAPVRDLTIIEAHTLATVMSVYHLGYLLPVRDLTNDHTAIASEFALAADGISGPEFNELHLFRGDGGTEAVVIEHRH
jgi:hypothetical protein